MIETMLHILSKDPGEKPAKKAKGKIERDLSRYRWTTSAAFVVFRRIGGRIVNGNILNSKGVHVAVVTGHEVFSHKGQKLYDQQKRSAEQQVADEANRRALHPLATRQTIADSQADPAFQENHKRLKAERVAREAGLKAKGK
jgi:hypothetical protein